MEKFFIWLKNGLVLAGVLALGFWLGAGRTAKASSYDSGGSGVQFQLTGVDESSSLLIYQPGTKTVYVYRGATTGNAALQCSFMFQLDRPGDVVRRIPCRVASLNP
ncbi:MAG TPA: hypothetical protein VMD55_01250 [Terracidiphilus sp.]|jgi:hypothetical protein|nr:hypothetical protein [Terracidiphilus sp.]